jgi:hypothetical protein
MTMRRKYIDIPDHARRDFVKWTVGLGAALGLRPWKVFEVTESVVGPAVAGTAACTPVNRTIHNIMGNGGFAWMTQLWPHLDQATKAGASFYATGQATDQAVDAEAGDHAFKLGPAAPFQTFNKKMTAFIAGTNETHTGAPQSAANVATGVRLFAAVAALQTASPTLVPAIGIGNLPYGTAAGAPAIASVPNPAGMVDIFNSAASTAGGLLANANDAALFEAYYKANLGLHAAASRPTLTKGLFTGKVSANLLGKNLASQLKPTATDLGRYGVTSGTPAKLQAIANTLITAYKAFKLNLTSSVLLPGMNDDPHGAFADMGTLKSTVDMLGKIWDTFMSDMMAEPDPMCAGAKLGDNLVVTWSGDTPKTPLNPNGWGDGTPQNSNWIYVMGNGWLKSGWFGQVKGDGTIETFNASSGANVAGGQSAAMAGPAGAAVLYAVARGDMRRVSDFFRGGDISGITVAKQS